MAIGAMLHKHGSLIILITMTIKKKVNVAA